MPRERDERDLYRSRGDRDGDRDRSRGRGARERRRSRSLSPVRSAAPSRDTYRGRGHSPPERRRDDRHERDRDAGERRRFQEARPDRDRDRDRERDAEREKGRSAERRRDNSRKSGSSRDGKNEPVEEVVDVDLNAGVSAEELAMMQAMGIPTGFDTTSGKMVEDENCHVGAVRVKSKRQARQYMNRRGGFNRPLPAEKSGEKINPHQ
mmetsp:Transcript_16366/g.45600  ORF Transcript_16366/g.45600 Transcript_16366/m.45600 type:complete len:208 (+) Transcript_16366:2562-3185(+)